MGLTRDQIKEAKPSFSEFPVPEWGEDPLLMAWPSIIEIMAMQDAENFDGVDMLIACAVDDDGAPLFTSEDREWLENKKGGDVFARIVEHVGEMFGAVGGNSESAQAGASSSD